MQATRAAGIVNPGSTRSSQGRRHGRTYRTVGAVGGAGLRPLPVSCGKGGRRRRSPRNRRTHFVSSHAANHLMMSPLTTQTADHAEKSGTPRGPRMGGAAVRSISGSQLSPESQMSSARDENRIEYEDTPQILIVKRILEFFSDGYCCKRIEKCRRGSFFLPSRIVGRCPGPGAGPLCRRSACWGAGCQEVPGRPLRGIRAPGSPIVASLHSLHCNAMQRRAMQCNDVQCTSLHCNAG
jgi:hypothetical protein